MIMLNIGLRVKTVNIEIYSSNNSILSQSKLLQYTKLAITVHLYTKIELKFNAFAKSNVPASHFNLVIHYYIDRLLNKFQN